MYHLIVPSRNLANLSSAVGNGARWNLLIVLEIEKSIQQQCCTPLLHTVVPYSRTVYRKNNLECLDLINSCLKHVLKSAQEIGRAPVFIHSQ